MIIDRLVEKVIECKNHTVVGLDPRLDYVPEYIKQEAIEAASKENGFAGVAAYAFYRFNQEIIDQIHDIVPAVKPQIAFYEQYGAAGLKCFIDTCAYAAKKGMIVVGDVKRGDIGSTAEGYSEFFLGEKDYSAKTDIITVNPYLGTDSIEPFIKDCTTNDKGLFILVKTSNKSSIDLQDLRCGDKTVYEHVAEMVVRLGGTHLGSHGYSRIGAVVGATFKQDAAKLRKIMKNQYFLVPGYGAQGGTAEDTVESFNEDGLGAIVNSSRGIIAAHLSPQYREKYTKSEFALASRAAAEAMRNDINDALAKHKKRAW